jgi:large subunit ribosomal protein L29
MKKISELRERSVGDLAVLEQEIGRDLWKTRFSNYTNQLDDTAKVRRLRRQIARIKTIMTQKSAPPVKPAVKPTAKPAAEVAATSAAKPAAKAAKPAAKQASKTAPKKAEG